MTTILCNLVCKKGKGRLFYPTTDLSWRNNKTDSLGDDLAHGTWWFWLGFDLVGGRESRVLRKGVKNPSLQKISCFVLLFGLAEDKAATN